MNPFGSITTLVSITSGANPSLLMQASDGNFYGTIYATSPGTGAVFKMTPGGSFTTLASFTGSNGSYPSGGALVEGFDGSLYGTTTEGGSSNSGTIFKITKEGNLTTIVHFTGQNGGRPAHGLMLNEMGDFYGSTSQGGTYNTGTIFKLTQSGSLSTIFNFDSEFPSGRLLLATDGNIYGTSNNGGDFGSVFRIN